MTGVMFSRLCRDFDQPFYFRKEAFGTIHDFFKVVAKPIEDKFEVCPLVNGLKWIFGSLAAHKHLDLREIYQPHGAK